MKESSKQILKGSSETVSTSQALSILHLFISHPFCKRKIQSSAGELRHMANCVLHHNTSDYGPIEHRLLKRTLSAPLFILTSDLFSFFFYFLTYNLLFESLSLYSYWSCLLFFFFFPFPLFTFKEGNLFHCCWNMQSPEKQTLQKDWRPDWISIVRIQESSAGQTDLEMHSVKGVIFQEQLNFLYSFWVYVDNLCLVKIPWDGILLPEDIRRQKLICFPSVFSLTIFGIKNLDVFPNSNLTSGSCHWSLSRCIEQLLKVFTSSCIIPSKMCMCCCNMPRDLVTTNLRRLRARLRPPASASSKERKQNSCHWTAASNSENLRSSFTHPWKFS